MCPNFTLLCPPLCCRDRHRQHHLTCCKIPFIWHKRSFGSWFFQVELRATCLWPLYTPTKLAIYVSSVLNVFFGSPPMSAKKDRKKKTYMYVSSILKIELIWQTHLSSMLKIEHIWQTAGKHPSEHCHHWTPLSWPEIKQEPGSGLSSDDPRFILYLTFLICLVRTLMIPGVLFTWFLYLSFRICLVRTLR